MKIEVLDPTDADIAAAERDAQSLYDLIPYPTLPALVEQILRQAAEIETAKKDRALVRQLAETQQKTGSSQLAAIYKAIDKAVALEEGRPKSRALLVHIAAEDETPRDLAHAKYLGLKALGKCVYCRRRDAIRGQVGCDDCKARRKAREAQSKAKVIAIG